MSTIPIWRWTSCGTRPAPSILYFIVVTKTGSGFFFSSLSSLSVNVLPSFAMALIQIFLLQGDQTKLFTPFSKSVNAFASPPDAGITYNWFFSSRVDKNAIFEPSADHDGEETRSFPCVHCVTPPLAKSLWYRWAIY